MPRVSFGPTVQERTRNLLAVLVAYGNDELEIVDRLSTHIAKKWQGDRQLKIDTTAHWLAKLANEDIAVEWLVELTKQQFPKIVKDKDEVREALDRLGDIEMLADHRFNTQGSQQQLFTITLRYSRWEMQSGIRYFDQIWEAKRQERSGHTSHLTDGAQASARRAIQSWGEAPDVTAFYGREDELKTLKQWAIEDCCRLIALLAMGGMGKTVLSVKLAQQLVTEFDAIIWRSLRNAPPIQTLLQDLLLTLSDQKRTEVPETIDQRIESLMGYLKTHRCLLILDNFESLLQPGKAEGAYQDGHGEYGHLLRDIRDSSHQSCLILTSREKPIGLSPEEGAQKQVRSIVLEGIGEDTTRQLLQDQDIATESGASLLNLYNGNPLALKIAISTIRDLFNRDVNAFLKEETTVFGGIAQLLAQQVNRLSPLELKIMQWLALGREPVTIADLRQKLVPAAKPEAILNALNALKRRSLIEQDQETSAFTQQPVVMEYVTEQFIEQFTVLFNSDDFNNLNLLHQLALIEANAKDYVRQAQQRVILQPIAARSKAHIGSKALLKKRCDSLLANLHQDPKPGYAAGNLINLMQVWQLGLTGYDFSNLTVWQLYLPELQLPNTNFTGADLSRSVFTQTLGGFLSVAHHPKAPQLATAISNEVVVWNTDGGQLLLNNQGHTDWVRCLAYSPDGTLLASGSRDETIRLWDATGHCVRTLRCPDNSVQALVFDPAGQTLVSGGSEATIQIWDVDTGSCQQTLKGHSDRVWALRFSENGQALVSSSQDGTVCVWDMAANICRQTWNIPINWSLAMDLSPDGRTLMTGSEGQTVKRWDLDTGTCRNALPDYQAHVWSVVLSPDGQQFLTASEDNTVKLWDVSTGDCLQTYLGHSHYVWLAQFSPDQKSLVSASHDQTVKLWDLDSGECLRTFRAYSNLVQSVAFCPAPNTSVDGGGYSLVSSGEDQRVRLWRTTTRDCRKALTGHTAPIASVAFSPDGTQIASGSDDTTIRLWDRSSGQCLRTLQGHDSWVQSVAFGPTPRMLASGGNDYAVRLWDPLSGECLRVLTGHQHRVKAVAVSPDGNLVVSGSDDHTVKLWPVDTSHQGVWLINAEQPLHARTLEGHSDWVLAVAFYPLQARLASGSGDRTIKIWTTDTGDCVQTLQAEQRVRSLAFSPDGQVLASCGDDGTVQLWDWQAGICQREMTEHSRAVWSVAFSRDGQLLASCGEDETIRLWQPQTGNCVKVLRPKRPYEGMNIHNVEGLTLTQRRTLMALGAVDVEPH